MKGRKDVIADTMKVEILATGVIPGQFYRTLVKALDECPELANTALIIGGVKPVRRRKSYQPYAKLGERRGSNGTYNAPERSFARESKEQTCHARASTP